MKLLHIVATPRSHASNTARISHALLEALGEMHADLDVSVLDLFSMDLPAVAGINIESKYQLMTGQKLEGAQKSSWEKIEAQIRTFLETDIYLLTVPMWNFTIPYALKYYIDAIVQPGYLFHYDANGVPKGLVENRKMICVTSRGGDYAQGTPLERFDFVEPYLRAIFGFVGITDMHFIHAQPMDISLDIRNAAVKRAISQARDLVTATSWSAPSAPGLLEYPEGVKPPPLQV